MYIHTYLPKVSCQALSVCWSDSRGLRAEGQCWCPQTNHSDPPYATSAPEPSVPAAYSSITAELDYEQNRHIRTYVHTWANP